MNEKQLTVEKNFPKEGWALIIILSVAVLYFGFFIYAMSQPVLFDGVINEAETLTVHVHSWGASNAYVTLTVENIGAGSVSVERVLVDDVAASDVAYGPAFSGPANTLSEGATGTITITQQFSSGIQYEFALISAGNTCFMHNATAP